ncbi:hypothetical protein H1R20_g2531, partial [Candolleomyces eurysporus]
MASSGPRLHALIIGIDNYLEKTGLDKLQGAVADADRIRNWLIDDFNVPASQIQDLRNENATRKAIIWALRDLSTNHKIQRDDPILIYYAGYGSEALAPKRWRWASPRIQMIVPWDYKHPDGYDRVVWGIPDRTLGVLLGQIAESKGDNITVIFDSCSSDYGSQLRSEVRVRGIGLQERELPADLDDDLVLPSTVGSRALPKLQLREARSHVFLSACALHERASEIKSTGTFTRALLRAFKGIDTAEITYEGLIKRMGNLPLQTPQCEGLNKDRFLFNRKVSNIKSVLSATLKDGSLTIAGAGAFHGISIGSQFAIWRSQSDLPNDPLATVTVNAVRGHESMAPFKKKVESMAPFRMKVRRFVAQIKENPKPQLFIHVPQSIQNMDCFISMISENENRRPLSIIITQDAFSASIGLTYLGDTQEIGFKMLNPEEQEQKIRHTIETTADDLHRALSHLCSYYYLRDCANTNPRTMEDTVPSSKFTIDMFTLEENDEEIYMPSGPNLNIEGTGVELTLGPHNEEQPYGFKITNNTNFPVFPYLFYFNSSDFSITLIYQPTAIAPSPSLPGHSYLKVGYGSAGATPQNFNFSDDKLDLEQGYLRLYVSTQHHPSIWGAITVPMTLTRGEESTPVRMIGVIGSRNNGKSTVRYPDFRIAQECPLTAPQFLEELFNSLYGNTRPRPRFANEFVKEYLIKLPGPDEEELAFVDLPAFEDYNIYTHVSMLQAMVSYMATQYQKGRCLSSLIWCYNISKPRFTVVDGENLNLVKDMAGPEAMRNVTVLATNWNKGAGFGGNFAKPRTVAWGASPRQRYEKAESQLKSLFGGGPQFRRFGLLTDVLSRDLALIHPLELIQSLSRNEETFQVQREFSETRQLGGTTAGRRLRGRTEAEIDKRRRELRGLELELEDMAEDDPERSAIHEEMDDVRADITRLANTLTLIEK